MHNYLQFKETVLVYRMWRRLQATHYTGQLSIREANLFLRFYHEGLTGNTYLEHKTPALLIYLVANQSA